MLSNHDDTLCELVKFASEAGEENAAAESGVDEITSNGKIAWWVSQPKSGLVRKVLALSLTILAIVLALQKLDVSDVDLSELWKGPTPETFSSPDPIDLFDLSGEAEGEL